MATKTFYFKDADVSGHRALQDGGTVTTATTGTGWIVGALATGNFSRMVAGTKLTQSSFSTSSALDTAGYPSYGSCWRTENQITGTFNSGTWTIKPQFRAVDVGGSQDGRIRCRVWASTSADAIQVGQAREITTSTILGSVVTDLDTTANQTSQITWSAPAIVLAGEYLFFDFEWEIWNAGSADSDVVFRVGSTQGCEIDSTNFAIVTALPAATALTIGGPVFGTPAIGQKHALAAATALTVGGPTLGTPDLTPRNALPAATALTIGGPVFGTPAAHEATALPAATALTIGSPVFTTPVAGQKHNLAAATVLTIGSPVFTTPAVGQIHNLHAADTVYGSPSLGLATATQLGTLVTAASLTLSGPSLGTPAIGQKHVLAATVLTVGGPALGTPLCAIKLTLPVATALTIGGPTFGTPAIGTRHTLIGGSFEVGPPEFGAPILEMKDRVYFAGFSIGSPELGTPDLFQIVRVPTVKFLRANALDVDEDGVVHPIWEAIFTNWNDTLQLDAEGGSLVGRISAGRGYVEQITLAEPMRFWGGSLGIDWLEVEALQVAVAALQSSLSELAGIQAAHTATIAAHTVTIALQAEQIAVLQAMTRSLSLGYGAVNLTIGPPILGTPVLT